jgi:alkanesulfonate monooxygenase SsuD/methylene tetrahydromethanopterin reductase-like flavin-dependent oxidoreductase (luciferase family)
VFSAAQVACVGSDEAEVARRAAALGRDPAELRATCVAGTVEQAAEKLGRLADQGVTRVYLQVLDLDDLDHLHALAQLLDR